jgi:hypothetical protein
MEAAAGVVSVVGVESDAVEGHSSSKQGPPTWYPRMRPVDHRRAAPSLQLPVIHSARSSDCSSASAAQHVVPAPYGTLSSVRQSCLAEVTDLALGLGE